MPEFSLGWKRQLPDPRDYLLRVPGEVTAALPPSFDLSAGLGIKLDQGSLGSCFDGDVAVPLLNGRRRTLRELASGVEGPTFWVYSSLPDGRMVPGLASASMTRRGQKVVEVELDNGEKVICTPDHRLMMRDGTYCEAEDLQVGSSLMPWNTMLSSRGYELLFGNDDGKYHYTHWLVAPLVNEVGRGVIHHMDFDKRNNEPSNLLWMTGSDHTYLHAVFLNPADSPAHKAWSASKECSEKSRETALRMHRENPGWNLGAASKGGKAAWQAALKDDAKMARVLAGLEYGRSPESREKANESIRRIMAQPEHRRKLSEALKKAWAEMPEDANAKKVSRRAGRRLGGSRSLQFQVMKHGCRVLKTHGVITEETWEEERRKGVYNTPKFSTAMRVFRSLSRLSKASEAYNHKVVAVRELPERRDVYCLRVPEVENFALCAGVYVHNCGPNSASELIEFDEKAESLGDSVASRLFIYYCTRDLMGTTGQDSGVDNRTMMKALNQFGFPPETSWPYDVSRFAQKPPQAVYDAAAPNRITAYATVTQIIEQMKGCLVTTGRPFVFGFDVFGQIMSDEAATTGVVRDPAFMESPVGGHDVTIVSYDDAGYGLPYFAGKGAFKFRNHWKTGNQWWGNPPSYGYISYQYALNKNLAGDFWSITGVPVPAPAPSPGPNPPNPPPPAPPSPCRPVAKEVFRFVQNLAKHLGVEP